MLKLKDPIKLHTTEPMCKHTDVLEQKILANYGVMGAQLIPEDLLHLTTAPMEVFLQEGNMTSLVVDNRMTTSQNVKLDMINNVVNRIALSDNATLTYQDQVYITNILQKLGVYDTVNFMDTVRQMRTEQIQSHKLVEQYRNTVLEYMGRPPELNEPQKSVTGDGHGDSIQNPEENWVLHQDIYRRLGTIENIYQMEHFTTSTEGESLHISRNQMLQSEYMRMANSLLLAEYRGYVTQQLHGPAVMGANPYEYPVVSQSLTTAEITAQLSQSVLYHTLSQLFSSRINQFVEGDQFHYDLRRALSKTAENSVHRFELFHNEGRVLQASHHLQQSALNQLLQNEFSLLEHYNGFVQYTADEQRYLEQNTAIWQGNRLNMTYLNQFNPENLLENITEETVEQGDSTTEITHLHRQLDTPVDPTDQGSTPEAPPVVVERQVALTKQFRQEMLHQERVQVQNQMMIRLHNLFQVVNTMHYLKQQDMVQILTLRNFSATSEELSIRQTLLSNSMAFAQELEFQHTEQELHIHHQEADLVEGDTTQEITVEAQNTALKQYLEQVNNENVRRQDVLRQTLQKVVVPSVQSVLPDLNKTKELAMLAIQSPEKLKSFLAQAEKVDTTKPINPQIEAILSILDPMTRQLMEKAIYHDSVTQKIPTSSVQLNTNLLQLMSDITNIQTTTNQETKALQTQVETILYTADLETRIKVEELLEKTVEQQSKLENQEERQQFLTQLTTEINNIQSAVMEQSKPMGVHLRTILQDGSQETQKLVETYLHQLVSQHTENSQILQQETTLSQLMSELRHFQSQQVAGVAGQDGTAGGVGVDGVTMTHMTQEIMAGQSPESLEGVKGADGLHTTQIQGQRQVVQTTRIQSVLEQIYRNMEGILPAEAVARVIQRELLEYTNLHETRQVFDQLEQRSQQVYDQVIRQYETVEKVQKERIVEILTENTNRQLQQETTQETHLQLEHRHTTELVSEQISQTIADILYGTVAAVGPEYAETVVRQSVPMVLKQMETEIPEELTELLQTKQFTQVEKEEFQVVQQEKKTTTIQTSKLDEELQAHDAAENVKKLVEKSIKNQVSAITDQVYQKLERRLQMERARRGK